MITLELTPKERVQFHAILPATGSIKTLETVERILNIIKINEVKEVVSDNIVPFEFSKDDINFLRTVISALDQAQQISFQALSLVRKILNIKE